MTIEACRGLVHEAPSGSKPQLSVFEGLQCHEGLQCDVGSCIILGQPHCPLRAHLYGSVTLHTA